MKNKFFYIFNFFIFILFISCSSRYISVKSLNNDNEAFKGDTVKLKWKISNADYVKIDGFDNLFGIDDNITITADTTTFFILKAYRGKKDSIVRKINVKVKPNEAISGIDYTNKSEFLLTESNVVSDHFIGIKDFSKANSISKVKITGLHKESNNSTDYNLRFILLDDFGNFIDNVSLNESGLQLSLSQAYGTEKYTHIYNHMKKCENKTSDIALLIDNSLSQVDQKEILFEIEKFIDKLPSESKIMLSTFNHKYENIIKLSNKNSFKQSLNGINLKPNGLNSLFEAICQAISDISLNNNNNKILIILLNNADNSSLNKNYSDCIELSKQFNTPVYFVIMNEFISSYQMKLISSQTGGNVYYRSDYGDNFDLSSLIKEIELSNKHYYEVKVPFFSSSEKSKVISINLNLIKNEEKITDKTLFFSHYIKTPGDRKIIATFDENEHTLKEDFADKLFTLAQMLIDNSERKIKLFGHSSKSELFNSFGSISQKRASDIKERLIYLGVNEEQIEISDFGSTKPIYSLEEENWQKTLNRRVEFKWIDPTSLPYEILAQITNSEYSAIKFTEEWEKQGFRSYFERMESMNEPLYKVKLWGFPTKEEAEKTIQKLNRKYSLVFDIE